MKQPIAFQGRSFLFNIIFVLLNLTGLTLVVIGYHEGIEENGLLLKLIGFSLMLLTISGLIIFKGRMMMSSIARVLVGGICIVSGLVKANDPLGFAYKLEEYFEDGALAYRIKELFGMPSFSLEFLIEYALWFSVIICIVEIILGVLLIIGGSIKNVASFTLIMMLFFTFLTWHTASCDSEKLFVDRDTYSMSDPIAMFKIEASKLDKNIKIVSKTSDELVVDEMKQPQCVDDCGCFGDAMKGSVGRSLTPKESMWKDFILVYLSLWIVISQLIIRPNNRKSNLYFSIGSLLVISFFSWVFGWSFPLLFGVIVLISALWILRAGGKLFSNYFGVVLIVSILSFLFIWYVLLFEPLKDYRPYAEGSDLIEKMNDGREGKYESMLLYKNNKTGETKEYSSSSKEYIDSKIWEDKNWAYSSMIQKVIVETKLPSISDFEPFIALEEIGEQELKLKDFKKLVDGLNVEYLTLQSKTDFSKFEIQKNEYNSDDYPESDFEVISSTVKIDPSVTDIKIKDYVLKSKTIFVITSKSLNQANWSNIDKLKSLYFSCIKKNIPFILICNASRKEINEFRMKNDWNLPVFVNDEITLKSIARSNPSLMILKKAVVVGKYPHRSVPKMERLEKTILKK